MSREIVTLSIDGALLRPLRESDVESLVHHANDRAVWRNLRDAFPHPYREADARSFLAMLAEPSNARVFGIEIDGAIRGACGPGVVESQLAGECAPVAQCHPACIHHGRGGRDR